MADIELLTGVLREIIYGEYRPEKMTELEVREWPGLFTKLQETPATPAEYIEICRSDDRLRRFRDGATGYKSIFTPAPFYIPAIQDAKPAHSLCVPFRNLAEMECRLIVLVMEKQKEHEIITILQYELISVRDELLDLLKETNRRGKDEHRLNPEGHIYRILFTHLLAMILELQTRYEELFEDHLYTEDQIWLNILGEPVPEQSPVVITTKCLSHRIPKTLREPGALKTIDLILTKLYRDADRANDASAEMNEVISYCENLFILIAAVQGAEDENKWSVDWSDPTEVSGLIESLNRKLTDGEKPDSQQDSLLIGVEKQFEMIRQHVRMDRRGVASQGVKLLVFLEQFQDWSVLSSRNRSKINPASSGEEKEDSTGVRMLNDYHRLENIQTELGVTDKPFKRYLKESGVFIVRFSDKNRWIHQREIEKLLAYYQQKVK